MDSRNNQYSLGRVHKTYKKSMFMDSGRETRPEEEQTQENQPFRLSHGSSTAFRTRLDALLLCRAREVARMTRDARHVTRRVRVTR